MLTLATVAAAIGLVTVLVALYRDGAPLGPAVAPSPNWDPLPAPADLGRVSFPLRVPGYDPVAVDVAFDTLTHAYADLLAAAPAAVRARAHERAALRLGVDPAIVPAHVTAAASYSELTGGPLDAVTDPLEALRVAAALAVLDRPHPPPSARG